MTTPPAAPAAIESVPAEELITVKEFAFLFGYHPNSVWRRVRAGKMPNAFKDGRSVRIRMPRELVAHLRVCPLHNRKELGRLWHS